MKNCVFFKLPGSCRLCLRAWWRKARHTFSTRIREAPDRSQGRLPRTRGREPGTAIPTGTAQRM